jgi:hypothetical protein
MNTFNIFIKVLTTTIFFLLILSHITSAQTILDLEGGIAATGYNDVRIPGDGGTFIGLSDELGADPFIYGRVRLSYIFNERNTISVLYAPLRVGYEGEVNRDVNFENVIFPASTSIDATYKFNSYRLTYRYQVLTRESITLGIGLTAKIRDAFIRFEGGGLRSEKTDLGFVPLINFRLHWQFSERFHLLLDGDALAAPQGRAEDVLVALGYSLTERIGILAGYRILEGGADNDEVYTFSLFHYGVVGVRIHL